MLAYHNDPQLKQQILEQLQRHYDADEIVKGQYWQDGKGCAVGCTLHTGQHKEYETRFGIPEILAHLEDVIFEGLPNDLAKTWPIRFMSSINVGADLSAVWREFVVWMLIDPVDGVIQYTISGTEVYDAIMQIATLYRDGYTQQQMREASYAAYAAYAASYAASYAAAGFSAAYAVSATYAVSAAAHAVSAAYAVSATYAVSAAAHAHASNAAVSAALATARNAAYIKMSNKLIELLKKQEVKNVSLP